MPLDWDRAASRAPSRLTTKTYLLAGGAIVGAFAILAVCVYQFRGANDHSHSGGSSKISEFRTKLGPYLQEVRAGAKLLESRPSAKQVSQKADRVIDLYRLVREPPADVKYAAQIKTCFRHVDGWFATALDFAECGEGFLQLNAEHPSPEAVAKAREIYDENLPRAAIGLRKAADEIERLAGN